MSTQTKRKPYCGVVNCDAFDLLADLIDSDVNVGAVVTDPPYSSGGMWGSDRMRTTMQKYVQSGQHSKSSLVNFTGDNRSNLSYLMWSIGWMELALQAVEDGGSLVCFTDWRQMALTQMAMEWAGWVYRGPFVWTKRNAVRPRRGYCIDFEFALWGTKGEYSQEKFLHGHHSEQGQIADRDHIAQKPYRLMRKLVCIARDGSYVVDPFSGSGTTLIAARAEGYHTIGSELVQEHFQTVIKRNRKLGDVDYGKNLGQLELPSDE